MSKQEEYVLVWEAPEIKPPEFRAYYDDKGRIITYTCEELEGDYVVIDAQTFAEARPDLRVVDGKIIKNVKTGVASKLIPSDNEGITCAEEDVSIVINKESNLKTQRWKLVTYEL